MAKTSKKKKKERKKENPVGQLSITITKYLQ
jgi:hypothetical protein